MSSKSKDISREIVATVRRCVQEAGAEFDGIQTSFTGLPKIIFQTITDPNIFVLDFDPSAISEKELTQRIKDYILEVRQHQRSGKMTLKEKLFAVYNAIDMIEKRGENTGQRYDYVKAADVTREIRKQLLAQRVYAEINFDFIGGPFTIARAKDKDAPFSAVLVKCSVVFHDLDSDETLTASGLGTGADAGDKAAYKAQTGAMKYALKNAFLVPDEADPEGDPTVDDNGGGTQVQELPDFQDAKRGAAAPRSTAGRPVQFAGTSIDRPAVSDVPQYSDFSGLTESLTESATASIPPLIPDKTPEKGDAYEPLEDDNRLPTEEELNEYRKKFTLFGNDVSDKGKLKASKGLPVPIKLKVFLLSITKAASPKELTKAQWDDFFSRVDKKAAAENGFLDLTKLINKASGIEDKK